MAKARSAAVESRAEADNAPRSLWRNLDYMYWWTGNGVSALGTSISTLAFPLLVLHATGSAAQAGSITACHMIGALVTLPLGGTLADRVSRRALMVLAPLLQALAMGTIALLVHRGDPAIAALDALALAGGLAAGLRSGVSMPALRRIVPKEQVSAATAQGMGRDMVARLVGAPLGGLLYSLARWVPFLFDAVSFLFVALASALIRRPLGPDGPAGPRPGVFADMADGLRMIRRSDYLVFTILWGAALNAVTEGFTLLFVVLVQFRGGGPTEVGTASSLALAGGLLGSVAGPALMRGLGARTVLRLAAWMFVACFGAVVWVPRPWQIGLVLLVAMASIVPLNVVTESYQVRLVPDAYLGRVASAHRFSVQVVQWAGPLGAGLLADALGVRGAIGVLAVVMAVLALALHVARHQLRILDRPPAEVRELAPVSPAAAVRGPDGTARPEILTSTAVEKGDRMTEHPGFPDRARPEADALSPVSPPAVPSADGILAADRDRDLVAERVRTAVAEGRLELGELDERLAAVYAARTLGELRAAGLDLPVPGPRDALVVDRTPASPLAVGVFGGFARRGEWVVPPRFTALSVWGGGRLDLTEARFARQETEIRAVALWGATEILLPEDIEVEVKGFGLFGVFGRRGARRTGRPGTPRVVIKGIALFGFVKTRTVPGRPPAY
ncbi:MFS transporter [Streptomyces sp. NBC_01261]|uniref:MFS transporter n=1 Tax=Streptomyces sp. NBC_01261 TaxID=2903802 RepID=UPI002E34C808|nr:MFS transporter [Streptomyces sp. NBC_01261]